MSGHKRVKDIDYDDDDLYSGSEDEYDNNAGGDGLTDEDRQNFASLTPVVRAELDEAGIPTTTKEIEDALWHYFWDVGKSVAYLKNAKQPKQQPKVEKKEKAKSKFDQAQEKAGGEFFIFLVIVFAAAAARELLAGPLGFSTFFPATGVWRQGCCTGGAASKRVGRLTCLRGKKTVARLWTP